MFQIQNNGKMSTSPTVTLMLFLYSIIHIWSSLYSDGLKNGPVLLSNSQVAPGRKFSQPRDHFLDHLCTLNQLQYHVSDEKEGHQRVPAKGQRRGQGRQGALPALRLGRQREKGLMMIWCSFDWGFLMLDVQGCGMGWVDLDFDVPPSARFCLGQWEFGRTGWAGGQDDGTSKSKSTQPR